MKKGFTIIETTLVLSISALFAVGLMVGWSVNINRQRYNDAVNTFKTDIQDIFADVENPVNSRTDRFSCQRNGNRVAVNNGTVSRGSSECIILGKVIAFTDLASGRQNDGSAFETKLASGNFASWDLVGFYDDNVRKAGSSIEAIRLSRPTPILDSRVQKNLEWDATITMATDNRGGRLFNNTSGTNTLTTTRILDNGATIDTVDSLFIVRSPLDGKIMVFGGQGLSNSNGLMGQIFSRDDLLPLFQAYIDEGRLVNSSNRAVFICVRNPGANRFVAGEAVFGRNKMIKIGNTSSSVEVMPLDGVGSGSCGNGVGFGNITIDGGA